MRPSPVLALLFTIGSLSLAACVHGAADVDSEAVGTAISAEVPEGLSNPPESIPPSPDFETDGDCSYEAFDNSTTCVNNVLAAIKNARAMESLGPMQLPTNWYSLTDKEQLYVATNLERTARNLPPMAGMAHVLDGPAETAAKKNEDPEPPRGFKYTTFEGNWAAGMGNPLEAIYLWMYDDGLDSPNTACTEQNQTACWGHRDNILASFDGTLVMGIGFALAYPYDGLKLPSWTESFAGTPDTSLKLDFAWTTEVPYL